MVTVGARIAGDGNRVKWSPFAYLTLYLVGWDRKIRCSRDWWSRTEESQLSISRYDVPTPATVDGSGSYRQTQWRRAMRAFHCISLETMRILGIIPNPEDPSDSLPSKCCKIPECWYRGTGCEAANCFIQPCADPITLARRIFLIGDNIRSVDNLWVASAAWSGQCKYIMSVCRSSPDWLCWAYLGHIPDCGQFQHTHPLLLLQMQIEIPTGIRDVALSKVHTRSQVKKECKWTLHEHTSDTSLSTNKRIHPSYIFQGQWDDLYPDLH